MVVLLALRVSEFNFDIDLENWWYGHNIIHPALRLNKFNDFRNVNFKYGINSRKN
jgi:hypothetical protein